MRKDGLSDTGKKASVTTSTTGSAVPVLSAADSSSPAKTVADTLDVSGALGLDTATGSPAKFSDTANAFKRRPGYRGMIREALRVPDTIR
jgi:hypothetical protein